MGLAQVAGAHVGCFLRARPCSEHIRALEVGVVFLPVADEETEARRSATSSEATRLRVVGGVRLQRRGRGSVYCACCLGLGPALESCWRRGRDGPVLVPGLAPDAMRGSCSLDFTSPRHHLEARLWWGFSRCRCGN